MCNALTGVQLLCPSCGTALAEWLTCPICLAAFPQDDSAAFIVPSGGGDSSRM